MKQTALILAAILLSIPLEAQTNYRVIRVNGKIQYVKTGNDMASGDVFAEDEALSFESPDSRAAVINPEKGRFILTQQTSGQSTGAKSNFLPARSNISTRGGALNSLNDLQDLFEGHIAILHEASWHVNPYQFPMDDDHFFFLQFRYGGEQINKKLPFRDNMLVMSREEILKVDEKPIPALDTPVTILNYYAEGSTQYISSFNLIFPDLETFRAEAGIILEEFEKEDYPRKVNELSGYLYEFYGKPDKEDTMLFLEKDFGIKK